MLRSLLETWYSCAQKLGDVELSVRLLVEMLGHGSHDEETVQESLLAVCTFGMTFSCSVHTPSLTRYIEYGARETGRTYRRRSF